MVRDDASPIRLLFLVLDHDDGARTRSLARLAEHPGIQVVGDAADASEALRAARELQPDAVLIESHVEDRRMIEAIALLSSIDDGERPALVAYLEIVQRDKWPEARAAGADDLLLKEMPPPSLVRELRSIVKHVRSVSP